MGEEHLDQTHQYDSEAWERIDNRQWIVGYAALARSLGVGIRTLKLLNLRVPILPYHRRTRVVFLRSQLHLLLHRIYVVDNGLRPQTLARMFNTVIPKSNLTKEHFKRLDGRWVLR